MHHLNFLSSAPRDKYTMIQFLEENGNHVKFCGVRHVPPDGGRSQLIALFRQEAYPVESASEKLLHSATTKLVNIFPVRIQCSEGKHSSLQKAPILEQPVAQSVLPVSATEGGKMEGRG